MEAISWIFSQRDYLENVAAMVHGSIATRWLRAKATLIHNQEVLYSITLTIGNIAEI